MWSGVWTDKGRDRRKLKQARPWSYSQDNRHLGRQVWYACN